MAKVTVSCWARLKLVKVDLEVGLKMVKAHDPGARLKMVKVAHLPDPYFPPVGRIAQGGFERCAPFD